MAAPNGASLGGDVVNRKLAALGVSLGVLGGGVVGFVATSGSPSASAELGGVSTPRAQQATDTTVAGSSTTEDKDTRRADRLTEVLAPLVENGTITQAQADAVIAALQDAMPMGGGHRGGPMGDGDHGGPMMGGIAGIGGQLDDIVGVLGLDIDDVMSALRDGKTIAELAEEQGVDVQKVIDTAVAAVKEHLDEAVASGDHTQAEADDLLTKATDVITKLVNGEFDLPFGGMGGGMGHHGGPFGRHGDDDSSESNRDPATTTTLG